MVRACSSKFLSQALERIRTLSFCLARSPAGSFHRGLRVEHRPEPAVVMSTVGVVVHQDGNVDQRNDQP